MNVLMIGSSHTGMLKQAWDDRMELDHPDIKIDFVAFTAPELSLQNNAGWQVDGNKVLCSENLLNNKIRQWGKSECVFADFSEIDVVCFVDLFYCYDFLFMYGGCERGIFRDALGRPISESVYRKVIVNVLGKSRYTNHAKVGDVGENNIESLFRAVHQASPKSRKTLIPRPVSPTSRVKKISVRAVNPPRQSDAVRMCEIFDEESSVVLREHDIDFLPRPRKAIDEGSGLTPDQLSVNWLEWQKDPAVPINEHLTGEYGRLCIEALLSKIRA